MVIPEARGLPMPSLHHSDLAEGGGRRGRGIGPATPTSQPAMNNHVYTWPSPQDDTVQATMRGFRVPRVAHGPEAPPRGVGSGISQLSLSTDSPLHTPLRGLSIRVYPSGRRVGSPDHVLR